MSLLLIIWFSVFSATYAHEGTNVTDDLTSRVLYGKRANIKDYPYFAAIEGCGAAIISDRWLVTAAHCVHSNTNKFVWVGGDSIDNSQFYRFDYVEIHSQYTYVKIARDKVPVNDIALLRLSRSLTFGSTVKAITLPQQEYEGNAIHKFAGMGQNEMGYPSKQLMRVDLRTLEANECLSHVSRGYQFSSHGDEDLNLFKKVIICTKRIEDMPGICFGDSGSPLVRNEVLVGLASFITDSGIYCHSSRHGMFTNVAPFVSWIKSVTGIK